MEENEQKTQKIIRISKKKFIIGTVLLIIGLFILGLFALFNIRTVHYLGGGFTSGVSSQDIEVSKSYPDFYNPTSDITDTREFLKTNYSAQIYTRNVFEVVERVEDIVNKVNGRVDGINSSEKYGRVSFVIPKSDLSEFRDEIETITHTKLYTETISSQNLLNQKQGIEKKTDDIIKSLTELEQEKKVLDQVHAQRISSIQVQINALQVQLNAVRVTKLEIDEEDQESLDDLNNQETYLVQQIISFQQDQSNENRSYFTQNSSLVSQINKAGGKLETVEKEDLQFMNNIETVEGYVDVRWISLWGMAGKLSFTPMWLNTILGVLLILWFLKREKILPKIQLV